MKKNSIAFLFLIVLFNSCGQPKQHTENVSTTPKGIASKGFAVPADSITPPEIIAVDESKIKKMPAGKAVTVALASNTYEAFFSSPIIIDHPKVNYPGRDSFLLPVTIPVADSQWMASTPEVVIAKEPSVKDQNPNSFSTFGKLQGLKHGNIKALLEDKNGNLWFGTDGGGACSYDGKSFSHFTVKEGFCGNRIWSIMEDNAGNIWFGSFGNGVNKYNGKTITHFSEENGLSGNYVACIFLDSKNNIWFATNNGACKYDGKTFSQFSVNQGLVSNAVLRIAEDKQGNIWFGTEEGVSKYDGKCFTNYTANDGLKGLAMLVFCDSKGTMWFATEGGVSQFDGKSFISVTEKDAPGMRPVNSILEDKDGVLWLATDGSGLIKYDPSASITTGKKYFTHFTVKEGLPTNVVYSLLKDRGGKMWLATLNGVCKYDGNTFTHLTTAQGLTSNTILNICKDKDSAIWIGSLGGGVSRLSADVKSITLFPQAEMFNRDKDIYSIIQDNDGSMWFGSILGATRFDGTNYVTFSTEHGLPHNTVTSMLRDKQGNLWFGTFGGAAKYNGTSFTRFNDRSGLSSNNVYCMIQDRKGNIWFGTNGGGVTRYDGKNFTWFTTQEGLPHNNVYSLLEDTKGAIWIATYGGGVAKYDGNVFTVYTEKEGLASDYAGSILEDRTGNLWFGTRYGLSKYSSQKQQLNSTSAAGDSEQPQEFIFKNYLYEDGFLGIGCNRNATCEKPDGTLLIATSDRLTTLFPKGEITDTVAPNIQLTKIELFNENIPWQQLASINLKGSGMAGAKDTSMVLKNGVNLNEFDFNGLSQWYSVPQNLNLAYSNNYLTFDYSAITVVSPQKTKYVYKLQGNDQQWNALMSRNEAAYSNLAPGNYSFRVKAMNSEGLWSKELNYPFTIRAPWWGTWWFRTFVVLGLLSAVYSLYRYRLMQQIKLITVRNSIASDLHDEIGSTLSSISLSSTIIQKKLNGDSNEISLLLKQISRNTDQVMESMSDIVWTINNNNDKFDSVVNRMRAFAIELLEPVNGTVHFNIHNNSDEIQLNMTQRKNLYLIFKEAINNAAKYAGCKNVWVDITLEKRKLRMKIKDDGIGFEIETLSQKTGNRAGMGGNGLPNMHKRAKELNGDLTVNSNDGKGTEVCFEFGI